MDTENNFTGEHTGENNEHEQPTFTVRRSRSPYLRPVVGTLLAVIVIGAVGYGLYVLYLANQTPTEDPAARAARERAEFLAAVEAERNNLPIQTATTSSPQSADHFESVTTYGEDEILSDDTFVTYEAQAASTEDLQVSQVGELDMGDVNVVGPKFDTTESPISFTGRVLAVDTVNQNISITSESDEYVRMSIFVTNATSITINDLAISIAELMTGDVLQVSGWPIEAEVLADSIAVVAAQESIITPFERNFAPTDDTNN